MMSPYRGFVQALTLVLIVATSGCSSFGNSAKRVAARTPAVPGLEGATSGSRFLDFLVASDKREIDRAAWIATQSTIAHGAAAWTNNETGSSGSVKPGVVYLVGFNAGAEIESPVYLDTTPMLEPIAGNYITTSNSNVRLAPEIRAPRNALVEKDTRVSVIAYEPTRRWYLIAQDNKVLGYVFADLITKIEGGDLLLAGGDRQTPRLCRELTYKMLFKTGSEDEWLNGACRQGHDDWSIVGGRALEAAG